MYNVAEGVYDEASLRAALQYKKEREVNLFEPGGNPWRAQQRQLAAVTVAIDAHTHELRDDKYVRKGPQPWLELPPYPAPDLTLTHKSNGRPRHYYRPSQLAAFAHDYGVKVAALWEGLLKIANDNVDELSAQLRAKDQQIAGLLAQLKETQK